MLKFPTFRVGGCVRDALLGVPCKDIDFAVEAPSFEALTEAVTARVDRVFKVDANTFTVRGRDPEFGAVDFVLCRKDGPSSDGRHPDFVEAGDIWTDLARRDFTVNAMAFTPTGELLDPHDGQADLATRTLRFVGDAEQRLFEDALRAFRAVRFSIVKGFTLTPEAHDALRAMTVSDFDAVSTERIRDELVPAFGRDTRRAIEMLVALPALFDVTLERGVWFKPTMEDRP